ncbi:hypothetical protein Desru_0670 [Desulforamulus ruminis DSM 2154]|uniref:Uncharacterized protein n=1 Tax=Desulforamulus ruminis (strain ATCC 23193 / DSM 2154 / NCIMB 8452 / DL) TaxID=696281 RepID=F6DTD8_DESRL|nr:hypothetical protein Desru_0670 [Desulforamulus ruminis DSM 2154]
MKIKMDFIRVSIYKFLNENFNDESGLKTILVFPSHRQIWPVGSVYFTSICFAATSWVMDIPFGLPGLINMFIVAFNIYLL